MKVMTSLMVAAAAAAAALSAGQSAEYPRKSVLVEISRADSVGEDDFCRNYCAENQRGFANNQLYYFGMQ